MVEDIISDQPKWLADLVAACRRRGIPLGPLGRRTAGSAPLGGWPVALRLRTGETLRVEVDDENHDYIRGWLKPGCAPAFIWFETADGCLMGINLAHVEEAVSGAAEPANPSPWNRDRVVLRFSDGASMQLPKITGETIDYLQGATIRAPRGEHLYGLCCGGETVSLDLDTLMCVTLPAAWLDDPV